MLNLLILVGDDIAEAFLLVPDQPVYHLALMKHLGQPTGLLLQRPIERLGIATGEKMVQGGEEVEPGLEAGEEARPQGVRQVGEQAVVGATHRVEQGV